MKIFITGGTGFIGTHLVKKLQERGHVVAVLGSNLAETEKWQKEVRDFHPDAVVHLAWEGLPDYSGPTSAKNIKYSLSLFNYLAEINCNNVLSVGSAFEKINPNDAFSVAKKIVQLWGGVAIKNFIWARIFYVYGPGQRETSLIFYLINCAKKGDNPEIKNPLLANDYIYIDDVAEALAILLEKNAVGDYEIGRGQLVANQEVINIVARALGQEWQKEVGEIGRNDFNIADSSKLKALDWEPKIDIEQGIKKVIALSKNN